MSKNKKSTDLPTLEDLHQYILEQPAPVNKREIARDFGLKGQDRVRLKALLRELTEQGRIEKTAGKTYAALDALPETEIVEITGIDSDGEILAKPLRYQGKGKPPVIFMITNRRKHGELKAGDQVLAKLKRINAEEYEGRILKSLEETGSKVVGTFKVYKGGGIVTTTDKSSRDDYTIPPDFVNGAKNDDLVVAEEIPPSKQFPRQKHPARVVEVLGNKDDPRLITLIAIHAHGIPWQFSKKTVDEAKAAEEPTLKGRTDLRHMPLVTIDGADARDFDDAVFAEADNDPKNKGGWKITVAIADVSHYVRTGSALDITAYERGNSTYFVDRVVPMLPEELSNDLCSLNPKVNRACLAAHMRIDDQGRLLDYTFVRGLMKSAARLTYEQVEAAIQGQPDDDTAPLLDSVIKPLYQAYHVLDKAREKRGALDLDLPERKVQLDKDGRVKAIIPRLRLDSHKLIEEFMILANVAAASQLEEKNAPCLYRIHDKPAAERIQATSDFLKEMDYSLPKGQVVKPENLNRILKEAQKRDEGPLVSTLILRTQSVAIYSPENVGHFGLALQKYAHFTSPIRRYADLIVHRSLVRACKLGDGGLSDDEKESLDEIGEHISNTERRSMMAERDSVNRFSSLFLSEHIGAEFKGHVNGVTRFGLFITLDDTGADGIVPIRTLPRDFYVHDEKRHALVGRDTGRTYRLAQAVVVRLVEANAVTGSTVFELLDAVGAAPLHKPSSQKNRKKYRSDRKGKGDKNGGGKKKHIEKLRRQKQKKGGSKPKKKR